MPDPRFYESLGPLSLAELAAATGADLADPAQGSLPILGVSILSRASSDRVTFLTDRRHAEQLSQSKAGACFVAARDAEHVPQGCAALIVARPHAAYAAAALRLHRPRTLGDDTAVSAEAELEDGVQLAAGVVIGPGARIGRGTTIGANSVIGPGVTLGRDSAVAANVTLGFTLGGDRVRILAGAVIGEPGFGATVGATGLVDIPQLGRVILQDGVTVGANSCIDRGAFDDTVIGENTKIDNLVQIAHNVRVGRNCVMAAHTGISGSVVVGDGVQFGGRAGVADHVNIGDGARIAAAAGIMKDVPAGETWGGSPGRPLKRWMRETAWIAKMAHRRREGTDA